MKPNNPLNEWKASAYLKSLIIIIGITFLGNLGKNVLFTTNLLMFYLLGVVFVSVRWGRGPGVLASIISAVAFDYFLTRPYMSFTNDPRHFVSFAGVLIVGLIVGELSIKTKKQANQMRLQESHTETLKLQAALLHSISHDLRTPLASITGSLSAVLENDSLIDPSKKTELLENAYEESARLNRIVGNLLDSARMEAGALKVSIKPCELRDVIGVSLQEIKYKLNDRPVSIHVPRDFPEVSMDFALIVKVMINLIDNALKYSPEGTPIEICAAEVEGWAKIEISNQGNGISEEDRGKIFDKFYRSSQAEKISGLGLGLWICKGIVEAHSGDIHAADQDLENKKTKVYFRLPLKGNIYERK